MPTVANGYDNSVSRVTEKNVQRRFADPEWKAGPA